MSGVTEDDQTPPGGGMDDAGEYVLGTLQGKARQQFERRLQGDADLRRQVCDWQGRLHSLNDGISPVTPPKKLLKKITARVAPQKSAGFFHKLGLWQAFSSIVSVSLILLVFQYNNLITNVKISEQLPQTIALLGDEQSKAGWLVERLDTQGNLAIKALLVADPGSDKTYELWMLPSNGQPPKSLGLMGLSGRKQFLLSIDQLQVFDTANALAVSLEPFGGSPTGLPTGPVLYQGKLLSI